MSERLYDIRPFREADTAFIMATMLRGLYYGDSWFSQIPKPIFMANYSRVIAALLASPNVEVRVACLKEDSDVILAYSILSADFSTIHWVFCKSVFRRQGIGRSLLPKTPIAVTHLSKLGKELLPKLNECVFNPFAL